jgi:hypothetical protein
MVLLIHHAGTNGRQRGTSRREDALDTLIALKRPEDYSPEQGARFEVHFEKLRNRVDGNGAVLGLKRRVRARVWHGGRSRSCRPCHHRHGQCLTGCGHRHP